MKTKQYQDIYRGYIIDYDINRETEDSYWVLSTPNDSVPLCKLKSYDDACDWIDAKKKGKV